jgi:hypothetical protein
MLADRKGPDQFDEAAAHSRKIRFRASSLRLMRLSLPVLRQGVRQAFPFRALQTLRGSLSPLREGMSKNRRRNRANRGR